MQGTPGLACGLTGGPAEHATSIKEMEIHTGEKPHHRCCRCHTDFNGKESLERHMKIHQGETTLLWRLQGHMDHLSLQEHATSDGGERERNVKENLCDDASERSVCSRDLREPGDGNAHAKIHAGGTLQLHQRSPGDSPEVPQEDGRWRSGVTPAGSARR